MCSMSAAEIRLLNQAAVKAALWGLSPYDSHIKLYFSSIQQYKYNLQRTAALTVSFHMSGKYA